MSSSEPQLWPLVGIPLLIFFARVLDVSVGTVRIILISRGIRRLAPIAGFLEILIWLFALGQVVQHLDRPANYLAYAGGFAVGTWVGILVEERLALGLLAVSIVTRQDAKDLIRSLQEQEFGVTSFAARGIAGHVRFLLTIIRKRDLGRLQRVIQQNHRDAFMSVSDVRLAKQGYFPTGSDTYRRYLGFLQRK
jgi:uncharacterized protein YebE (UPF0316 family)